MSRVTIGIPVYNGERYIDATLRSVLKQTYEDIEIIVSDNASTDATPEILRSYAAEDSRVRLILGEENIGAAPNYNRVLEAADSEYFAWLSADDLIEPAYVERAVAILDQRPEVVGVYSHAGRIDAAGDRLGDYRNAMQKLDLDNDAPVKRFRSAVLGFPAIVLFGVMRRATMLDTPGHGAFIGGDRVFVSEMALKGHLARVDEELFQRRVHGEAYSALTNKTAKAQWFAGEDAVATGAASKRIREHFAALKRSNPSPATLAAGTVTLLVQFPFVLFQSFAVSKAQAILQRFGRSLDYGRWAS